MTQLPEHLKTQLTDLKNQGLYKTERVITSPQQVIIRTQQTGEVINFCSNNYLGLANHPALIDAASQALQTHGFGLASVRFICGTQDLHKQLEQKIAHFLGKQDTILYTSCFDANTGLFETLLGPEDAIISDQLNHASVIDGIRLCKAQRHRYAHSDMPALEQILQSTQSCRTRLIATDGVFSMDGDLAKLDQIVTLAEKYNALLMVDDSHATGFMGKTGRGTAEHYQVLDKVDIITSTLGKALGGGSGGFTASNQTIIDLLRQRSRPYLFSNTLAPCIAAAGLQALDIVSQSDQLRQQLFDNTQYFRHALTHAGFDIKPGIHPIVPIMLYDANLAKIMADNLLAEGIYVISFSYPVVPKDQARIRTQITAAHQKHHLDQAIDALINAAKKLGILNA